jgi:hypothetical protein
MLCICPGSNLGSPVSYTEIRKCMLWDDIPHARDQRTNVTICNLCDRHHIVVQSPLKNTFFHSTQLETVVWGELFGDVLGDCELPCNLKEKALWGNTENEIINIALDEAFTRIKYLISNIRRYLQCFLTSVREHKLWIVVGLLEWNHQSMLSFFVIYCNQSRGS